MHSARNCEQDRCCCDSTPPRGWHGALDVTGNELPATVTAEERPKRASKANDGNRGDKKS